MGPSQERIALQLGTAFDLPLEEAAAVLDGIGKAIVPIIPTDGTLSEMQQRLLALVERLAKGDAAAIALVVGRLPYETPLAPEWVQLACRGWLEEARLAPGKPETWIWAFLPARHPMDGPPPNQALPQPPALADRLRRARAQEGAQPTPRAHPVDPSPPPAESEAWYSWIVGILLGSVSFAAPARASSRRRRRKQRSTSSPPTDAAVPAPPPIIMNEPEPRPRVMNDPEADKDTAVVDQRADEYRVWFGTNRKLVDVAASVSFSGERGTTVSYGYCDVHVPKSHRTGELGGAFIQRLVRRIDDRLKLRQTCLIPDDTFWSGVKRQLQTVALDRRHAVVFIHGYNVSFNAAALRAAQIGCDLGLDGAMAFFSWPSKGNLDAYKADEASIEASEPAIADFLVGFADKSAASAVHIIAHSMGNRAVLRAVDKIARDAQRRSRVPFANFILAAPDIDADAFRNLSNAYQSVAQRTTLYVSQRDRALALSTWLSDYPRAGYAPPVTVCDGIDTISVTNIDLTVLGHSYFGGAREVLNDMHSLIFRGAPPAERFGLKPESIDGKAFWVVRA